MSVEEARVEISKLKCDNCGRVYLHRMITNLKGLMTEVFQKTGLVHLCSDCELKRKKLQKELDDQPYDYL